MYQYILNTGQRAWIEECWFRVECEILVNTVNFQYWVSSVAVCIFAITGYNNDTVRNINYTQNTKPVVLTESL